MIDSLKSLWKDEDGPTMVEYALIVAVVALVAVVGFMALGTAIRNNATTSANQIDPP